MYLENNITMTSLPGNLSQEDIIHLLHLRFNNNPKIQFNNYEFHSLTEDLNGFVGDHYVLKITYTEADDSDVVHTANYFVKTKPTNNKTQIDIAESLNAYVKEIFMYNTLLQEYGRREYDINFAPTMYLCKNGLTMVLEDLKVRDFKLCGRTKFYGVSEMQACLKSLAKFHAASFVYEEDMFKELGTIYRLDQHYPTELKECFLTFEDETSIGSSFYKTSMKCFLELIDLFQEDEAWKIEFKKYLQEMDLIKLCAPDLKSRKACGHGDLWSNNMMFRYEDSQAVECVLLDYQLIRYFQPALDVLLAIYSNTRVSLRKDHLGEFVDCYYECLKETVEKRGYAIQEIYSRSSLEEGMERLTVAVQFQIAANHSMQFLDMDVVKKAVSGEEDEFKDILFDEKTTTRKNAFMYDPQFKAVIEEDLYELHRSLVKH
ncbi:uncharacterized protein CBL_03009 [Carabus blaptoides fortunei]